MSGNPIIKTSLFQKSTNFWKITLFMTNHDYLKNIPHYDGKYEHFGTYD